ncbi:MAG TPA: hypothetical protein VL179_12850 [Mycobacterium sp.]|nr:hypothetical protein [Mycobacterium sp.]
MESDHNTAIKSVRIIEGSPWKEAIITVLESGSPYEPWSSAGSVEDDDALVFMLDTDPVSVLSMVVTPGGSVTGFGTNPAPTLMELGTLNLFADFVVRPRAEEITYRGSPQRIVDTIGGYKISTVEALFGHTSLAAARVLLESNGNCTACKNKLPLTDDDAVAQVHIRTVDSYLEQPSGKYRYPTDPADWPATLCPTCHTLMRDGGFTNFLDFLFAGRPPCPNCGAHHSMSASYGLISGGLPEPWLSGMGCCSDGRKPTWICGECNHQW